jgi:hypothetical protein
VDDDAFLDQVNALAVYRAMSRETKLLVPLVEVKHPATPTPEALPAELLLLNLKHLRDGTGRAAVSVVLRAFSMNLCL